VLYTVQYMYTVLLAVYSTLYTVQYCTLYTTWTLKWTPDSGCSLPMVSTWASASAV
jgi:hypothetical protein